MSPYMLGSTLFLIGSVALFVTATDWSTSIIALVYMTGSISFMWGTLEAEASKND